MKTTPPRKLNLSDVFFESEKIHVANYFHFITLSFFFVPLSLYIITIPVLTLFGQLLTVDKVNTIPQKLYKNIRILMVLDENHQNSVSLNIFYILITYLLTICAISTITYSTHHGYSRKPVNFFTTVKSLTSTFFSIIMTTIIAHSLIFLIYLAFLLFIQTNILLMNNLGFTIDYNASYLSTVIYAILMVIVIYFHVNWSLAFVVVVAESKAGFSALRRSSDLVKGMRSVSFLNILYFGLFLGVLVGVMPIALQAFDDWRYVLFAMMNGVGLLMSYFRQWTSATTVLYNNCLAFHGESKIDEFGRGYVSLTSDDER